MLTLYGDHGAGAPRLPPETGSLSPTSCPSAGTVSSNMPISGPPPLNKSAPARHSGINRNQDAPPAQHCHLELLPRYTNAAPPAIMPISRPTSPLRRSAINPVPGPDDQYRPARRYVEHARFWSLPFAAASSLSYAIWGEHLIPGFANPYLTSVSTLLAKYIYHRDHLVYPAIFITTWFAYKPVSSKIKEAYDMGIKAYWELTKQRELQNQCQVGRRETLQEVFHDLRGKPKDEIDDYIDRIGRELGESDHKRRE